MAVGWLIPQTANFFRFYGMIKLLNTYYTLAFPPVLIDSYNSDGN